MSQTDAIRMLLDMSQRKLDDAAAKLGQLVGRQQHAEGRLLQLKQYRDDYESKLSASAAQGMDAITLANYRSFVAKLDTAIVQQTEEVQHWASSVQAAQLELNDEQRRTKSFEVIDHRRTQAETARDNRQQQKQIDEFAARAALVGRRGD